MKIKELTMFEFDNFAFNHPLGSFHQSSQYALLMAEQGFDFDYIGYVDSRKNILAASLIIYKKSSFGIKCGYAPKGFLIDYANKLLFSRFIEDLKVYYNKKNFVYITINPEIAIGEVDYHKTYDITYNDNRLVKNTLEENGFLKVNKGLNFETLLPRFNAFINLKNYNINKISKQTRSCINNSLRKGLSLELGNRDDLEVFYKFIEKKKRRTLDYYKDVYNIFSKYKMIDLLLVKVDYNIFLRNIKEEYEAELEENSKVCERLQKNNNEKNLNKKLASDAKLESLHTHMINALKGNSENHNGLYIAGALIIKYKNRVNIYISGYNTYYESYNPNYFLHHSILKYYLKDFEVIDLNGISGNFSKNSKYYGLNKFKMGFSPEVFEFIGEYNLIINKRKYNGLNTLKPLFRQKRTIWL